VVLVGALVGRLAGVDVTADGDGCAGEDVDHGGVGAPGVAEGWVGGNQAGFWAGFWADFWADFWAGFWADRFRDGTPGRCPDRVAPDVRATVGRGDPGPVNETVPGGACVVAESCTPNGTKNQTPASATAPAATTPTFTSGNRRRRCCGPDLLV
jgi:hypothetical protein